MVDGLAAVSVSQKRELPLLPAKFQIESSCNLREDGAIRGFRIGIDYTESFSIAVSIILAPVINMVTTAAIGCRVVVVESYAGGEFLT